MLQLCRGFQLHAEEEEEERNVKFESASVADFRHFISLQSGQNQKVSVFIVT
jgi:hypothetical protein